MNASSNNKRARIVAIGICIALCGCIGDSPPSKAKKSREQRKAEAQEAISRTPMPRRYAIDGNQLLVVDVPVLDPGSVYVDSQRCFVWRDAEFRTSTISCPHPPELVPPKD